MMNGTDLDGKKIRVDYSITKRAHTPTPGMYMGRSVLPVLVLIMILVRSWISPSQNLGDITLKNFITGGVFKTFSCGRKKV